MAIYHLHVSIISRKTGRSAVAAAAYRAAEKLHDNRYSNAVNAAAYRSGENLQNERDGITHNYTFKRGVVHTEIMLPQDTPKEYANRATLWNSVEQAEKRKDAQTARDIDIALPIELNLAENIELMREYIKANFVDYGMIADFAIHDKQDGNPHAHVLLTTREVSQDGFGNKNRDWNKPEKLVQWRKSWADICNEHLRAKGITECIDHRTLKAQGIDREPTIHIGASAKAMERRGIEADRARLNKAIIERNEIRNVEKIAKFMHKLKLEYFALDREISKLESEILGATQEMNNLRRTAEQIAERAGEISAMGERLSQLKAEKSSPNLQRLEYSYQRAVEYFERTYKISPEQSATEVERLERNAESKKHLRDKLKEKQTSLNEKQEQVIFEYQRQKLYAELNPNKQKIYERLDEFSKSLPKWQNHFDNDLETITDQNFNAIVREMKPEQARELVKRLEIERVREREFVRER